MSNKTFGLLLAIGAALIIGLLYYANIANRLASENKRLASSVNLLSGQNIDLENNIEYLKSRLQH